MVPDVSIGLPHTDKGKRKENKYPEKIKMGTTNQAPTIRNFPFNLCKQIYIINKKTKWDLVFKNPVDIPEKLLENNKRCFLILHPLFIQL